MESNKKETKDTYKKYLSPNYNKNEVSRWTRWRREKMLKKSSGSKGNKNWKLTNNIDFEASSSVVDSNNFFYQKFTISNSSYIYY